MSTDRFDPWEIQAAYLKTFSFREEIADWLIRARPGAHFRDDRGLRYTEKEAQRRLRILVGPDVWYADQPDPDVTRFKYRLEIGEIREEIVNTFIKRLGLGRPMRA